LFVIYRYLFFSECAENKFLHTHRAIERKKDSKEYLENTEDEVRDSDGSVRAAFWETRGHARSRKRIRVKSSSGRDPSYPPRPHSVISNLLRLLSAVVAVAAVISYVIFYLASNIPSRFFFVVRKMWITLYRAYVSRANGSLLRSTGEHKL